MKAVQSGEHFPLKNLTTEVGLEFQVLLLGTIWVFPRLSGRRTRITADETLTYRCVQLWAGYEHGIFALKLIHRRIETCDRRFLNWTDLETNSEFQMR